MTTIERQKAVFKLDRFVVSCQFRSYLAETTRVTQSISSDVIVGTVHLFYFQMYFILFIRWFISLFVSVSICSFFKWLCETKSIFLSLCLNVYECGVIHFGCAQKIFSIVYNMLNSLQKYLKLEYINVNNDNRLCVVCLNSFLYNALT